MATNNKEYRLYRTSSEKSLNNNKTLRGLPWWLRLCSPNEESPGPSPGQGTRTHILQLRLGAAKYLKKKKKEEKKNPREG